MDRAADSGLRRALTSAREGAPQAAGSGSRRYRSGRKRNDREDSRAPHRRRTGASTSQLLSGFVLLRGCCFEPELVQPWDRAFRVLGPVTCLSREAPARSLRGGPSRKAVKGGIK